MRKIRMKTGLVFLCAVILFTASSCSSFIVAFSDGAAVSMSCGKETLNENEVRLIALHYKSAFENYYSGLFGADFWKMPAEEGLSYEEYVRSYWILPECRSLLSLCCMAADRGIRLSDQDNEKAKEMAKQVFSSMSEDEIRFSGASEEDLESLIGKFLLAGQVVGELTKNVKMEVNDEESRVADIALIRVSDPNTAAMIRERLVQEENFLTLANTYSEEKQIYYSVAKGDLKEPLNSTVFSLAEGEESPVLVCEGSYYLIRVISSYNSILSSKNRSSLASFRRFSGWEEINDTHLKQHPFRAVPRALTKIPLTDTDYQVSFDLFAFFD